MILPMNKIGTVACSHGFMPHSQASYSRFERRIGLTEILLLLIFVVTLASCAEDGESDGVILSGPSSIAPNVTTPANITVAATNASGTATTDPTITGFLNGASAFDVEDGAITTIINDAPAVFPLGTNTVTFSATDSDGNIGAAQATVTVADQTVPAIALLGLSSITLNVGDLFTDPGATASDNVDGDLTLAIVTGGSVNAGSVGLYTLTYDVSDSAANAAVQVIRSVSVQDSGAPVVTPPSNITVAATDATGTAASDAAIVTFLAGASALDAVDGPIATITTDAPTQFPLGVTTVTFSATDSSSNTGQAQATVTVSDQTAPVVTAPADLTVAATGPSGIAVTDPAIVAFLGGASATDNVDGSIATISNDAPGSFPMDVTTVIFSATDAAGNTGTAQATITVTPFLSVQMIAFSRDVSGQLDLFAIAEDGSGSVVTLADDPGDEVFGGSTSDNRVIFAHDMGGQNDIYIINDDGSGVPVALATGLNDELPVAVTAADEVIFMRSLAAPAPHSDLLSIIPDGISSEVPLANSIYIELFGGLTSDGRVVYDIANTTLTDSDVYSIFADGSGGMTLAATSEFEAGGGIAAGNVVVFARTEGGFGSPSDIFTIDADGLSAASPLVATAAVDELPVGVTASDLVIFIRSNGVTMNLFSIDAGGVGSETQLTTSGDILFYGGSTPSGRVIFNRFDLFTFQFDVFSINADGNGGESALAADPVNNEEFSGISSDERVIFTRTAGGQTDLYSINADGSGTEAALADDPVNNEVFKGVTANGRVIFERTVSGQTDLFSIMADGSAPEVPLATTPAADESFGGVF